MNQNPPDNTTAPRSVDQQQACSDAPADPRCQKVWKKRGMQLADAALTVARNDDCSALLHDEDAMPVSVCLLAIIYGVADDVAANAVRHWLRRPNDKLSHEEGEIKP